MSKIDVMKAEFKEMALYRGCVDALVADAQENLGTIKAGGTVPACILSQIVDDATESNIVVRSGMVALGMDFIIQESGYKNEVKIPAELAKPVLDHILAQAQIYQDKLADKADVPSLRAAYPADIKENAFQDPLIPRLMF